jgi:flagellar basal body-associated protein FliL
MKKENLLLFALIGVGLYFLLKKKSQTTDVVNATGSPAPATPFTPLDAIAVNSKSIPAEDIFKVKFALGKIPNTI